MTLTAVALLGQAAALTAAPGARVGGSQDSVVAPSRAPLLHGSQSTTHRPNSKPSFDASWTLFADGLYVEEVAFADGAHSLLRGTAGAALVNRLRRAMTAADPATAANCTTPGPASLGETVETLTWFVHGSGHSFRIATVGPDPACSQTIATALSRLGEVRANVAGDAKTVRGAWMVEPAAP